MRKHRLYVIRKSGIPHHHASVRFYRDTVTGECSVALSGFGCMLMFCMEKVIPELISLCKPQTQFHRQLPCDILSGEDFFQKFFRSKTF